MEVYASCASERSDTRKIIKVTSYRKDGLESFGKLVNTIESEVLVLKGKKLNPLFFCLNYC